MCENICRVFISRKTNDKAVGQSIRQKLEQFAGNLKFFDADDIVPHEDWRNRLRDELKEANLLFLVLTRPAINDFDWPLYEAGWFEDLDQPERKKIVCFYPDPEQSHIRGEKGGIPSQLAYRQAVKAEKNEVLRFLSLFYGNEDFTGTNRPLNPNVKEEILAPIAQSIADDINGGHTRKSVEYTNRYIQIVLNPGCKGLEPGTPITSDKETLKQVFRLGEKPLDRAHWVWDDIERKAKLSNDPMDFNRLWTSQLESAVDAMKSGDGVLQLTARFLGKDEKLYRPEIEVTRTYENGKMTVDVTFSHQVQDSWLKQAQPTVALAANLAVASRIRYELIEEYLPTVPTWGPPTIEEDCTRLFQVFENIESEGFFVQSLTRSNLAKAFKAKAKRVLQRLDHNYRSEIKPRLLKALDERNPEEIEQALEAWKENNRQFLDMALAAYQRKLAPPKRQEVPHLKEVVNQ